MKLLPALIIAAQFASASLAQAEIGDLWMGTIDLPARVKIVPRHGLDSALGSLVSSDGTPEVGYDIGGQFDAPILPRKDLTFYRHGTTNEAPWVAYRTKNMPPHSLSVWYPNPLRRSSGQDVPAVQNA